MPTSILDSPKHPAVFGCNRFDVFLEKEKKNAFVYCMDLCCCLYENLKLAHKLQEEFRLNIQYTKLVLCANIDFDMMLFQVEQGLAAL